MKPEPKKKVMGSVSCGNKLTEPHTISNNLKDPEDKRLKKRRDSLKVDKSKLLSRKVKLSLKRV